MLTRRSFCSLAAAITVAQPSLTFAQAVVQDPFEALVSRAKGALDLHAATDPRRDKIAVVNFGSASSQARFHLVDLAGGHHKSYLVAHGRGSDPDHSGWLERFSNAPGSAATSSGAYLTGNLYVGRHGMSRKLKGLDRANCNAEARAIVIHAADYVSVSLARSSGKIGRSEGCLAVAKTDLGEILGWLGANALIYADKA